MEVGYVVFNNKIVYMLRQQCKNYWTDVKSKEFEEKYIAPLPDAVTATSSIIDEIDKILTKIKILGI